MDGQTQLGVRRDAHRRAGCVSVGLTAMNRGSADTLLRSQHPSLAGFADTHRLRVRRHPSTPGFQTPIDSGVRRHPSTPGFADTHRLRGFADTHRLRGSQTQGFADTHRLRGSQTPIDSGRFADTHRLRGSQTPIDSGVRRHPSTPARVRRHAGFADTHGLREISAPNQVPATGSFSVQGG